MEQKAERLVREGLCQAGWGQELLCSERKGHVVKIQLAKRLRMDNDASEMDCAAFIDGAMDNRFQSSADASRQRMSKVSRKQRGQTKGSTLDT